MPRRKDTEIYTYKLKSGKTKYGFKTYVGINKENGKAIKVTRQGFNTRKEAEAAKTKIKADGAKDVANKRYFESNKKTVQEVYDIWFAIYKDNVRGSSANRASSTWDNNLKNEFGKDYIANLDATHLQQYAIDLAKTQISYRKTLAILHRVIKYAIKMDWCEKDPFDKIIMPKKSDKKSTYPEDNLYSLEELKKFLKAAKKHNYMYYTFFMILGSLGLRRGEALALKWKNIDFENQTMSITHTVSRNADNHKTIDLTKTPKSRRKLLIPNNLLEVLKEYKKRQAVFNKPTDYLFHTKTGDFLHPSVPAKFISSIYKFNPELRQITPHGFRHTLATLLYNANDQIKPKEVQEILGHSKVTMALDVYTHVTEEKRQNVKNTINHLNL